MQVSYFFMAVFLLGGVHCEEKVEVEGVRPEKERRVEPERERHAGERKEERLSRERERDEWRSSAGVRHGFLLHEKKGELVAEKAIEFFLNDPNTRHERECFANFEGGNSVDFVIDIAPSPSMDKIDTLVSESPVSYYLQSKYRSPTRDYFDFISMFIEGVTVDMKPELTHSIIYNNGHKYFLRGRECKVGSEAIHGTKGGEFNDMARNLKTLWPVATKSLPESHLKSIVKNNLARMTKLALWNRDNGLPTVLSGSKRSKAGYTVVITDGSSGAKIRDLTDDIDRTTVIDLGNQRFVKNLSREDMDTLVSVISLPAPASLASLVPTTRVMACRLCRR